MGWSVFTAKWDDWTSHLEVSGTPGRRDRLPYLRSNSKQSCRRPTQVTQRWKVISTAWHFRSKSRHILHISALVISPTLEILEFLWISQLLSFYLSRRFKNSQNIRCICGCTGPFALGCCHTARELSLREASWQKLQTTANHCNKTRQCILLIVVRFIHWLPSVFLDVDSAALAWVMLKTSHEVMSKTRCTEENQLEDETRNQGIDTYHFSTTLTPFYFVCRIRFDPREL